MEPEKLFIPGKSSHGRSPPQPARSGLSLIAASFHPFQQWAERGVASRSLATVPLRFAARVCGQREIGKPQHLTEREVNGR